MPCAKSSFCRFASKGTEELFVTLDRKLIGSGGWGGGGGGGEKNIYSPKGKKLGKKLIHTE